MFLLSFISTEIVLIRSLFFVAVEGIQMNDGLKMLLSTKVKAREIIITRTKRNYTPLKI